MGFIRFSAIMHVSLTRINNKTFYFIDVLLIPFKELTIKSGPALGNGGYGIVYSAKWLSARCAVKSIQNFGFPDISISGWEKKFNEAVAHR